MFYIADVLWLQTTRYRCLCSYVSRVMFLRSLENARANRNTSAPAASGEGFHTAARVALSTRTIISAASRYQFWAEKERLTVEGEVSEEGSQQVHDKHGQEGHVGNILHLFARTTFWEEKDILVLDKRTNHSSHFKCSEATEEALTLSTPRTWAGW